MSCLDGLSENLSRSVKLAHNAFPDAFPISWLVNAA
jgi:hypothetical protein